MNIKLQAYWSSALHLYAPLPFNAGKGTWGDYFKTHAFINAGNITDSSLNSKWEVLLYMYILLPSLLI